MFIDNTPVIIAAAEFKAHCLALMDEVKSKRQSVIITKHGVPVAKLVAADNVAPSLFGFLKDTIAINGDIIEPLECGWESDI